MQIPTIVFDYESLSKHTRSFDLVIGTERVIPYVQKNLSSFITSETKYIVKDHGYPTARILSNDTLEPIFDNSLNEERKLSLAIVGGGATIDYGKALVSLSRLGKETSP